MSTGAGCAAQALLSAHCPGDSSTAQGFPWIGSSACAHRWHPAALVAGSGLCPPQSGHWLVCASGCLDSFLTSCRSFTQLLLPGQSPCQACKSRALGRPGGGGFIAFLYPETEPGHFQLRFHAEAFGCHTGKSLEQFDLRSQIQILFLFPCLTWLCQLWRSTLSPPLWCLRGKGGSYIDSLKVWPLVPQPWLCLGLQTWGCLGFVMRV